MRGLLSFCGHDNPRFVFTRHDVYLFYVLWIILSLFPSRYCLHGGTFFIMGTRKNTPRGFKGVLKAREIKRK